MVMDDSHCKSDGLPRMNRRTLALLCCELKASSKNTLFGQLFNKNGSAEAIFDDVVGC